MPKRSPVSGCKTFIISRWLAVEDRRGMFATAGTSEWPGPQPLVQRQPGAFHRSQIAPGPKDTFAETARDTSDCDDLSMVYGRGAEECVRREARIVCGRARNRPSRIEVSHLRAARLQRPRLRISGYEGKVVRIHRNSRSGGTRSRSLPAVAAAKSGRTAGSRTGSRQYSCALCNRPLCRHPGGSCAVGRRCGR